MVEHQSNAEQRFIDDVNCRLLLASQHVGRLVVPGQVPSVVPLNYVVVDEVVYFRTDAGSTAARGHGTVMVFEVDALDELGHAGWSVVARGRVEDVTDWAATAVELDGRLHPWAPRPQGPMDATHGRGDHRPLGSRRAGAVGAERARLPLRSAGPSRFLDV
jgi:nitroimidazol reductase NimA-like FMN-containing flavoprotein (pyridoxamine 5'-phosphate oxidase superfamily)